MQKDVPMIDAKDEYKRFVHLYGLEDNDSLEKAFEVAVKAHEGQYRHSGEPFVTHPIAVASILAELGMDNDTIIAGLLHDVIEDTSITNEQIRQIFSPEIAKLVDGVTKLKDLEFNSYEEQQAESLRKMFLAMAADIRVVIIKLADRLHNMRTLKYQSENKQIEKAKETLEIYAPLAHRLGINAIKWELEDLSLKFLDPDRYFEIAHRIEGTMTEREKYLKDVIEKLETKLSELNIPAQIEGRPKHIYSIHKKMADKNKVFEEVYDLIGIRIIVKSIKDCYGALGLVHTIWKPLPMRFKDYIAVPKNNMYQSLHTTLLGDDGRPFEVQIRTFEMHKTAEYGIAAHWKYKEGSDKSDNLDSHLAWLRELMDWQTDMKDSKEFMESLKIDLFAEDVFVFTPKGDVHELPAGSTPLDFAYSIHSEIGHHCVGAKVNGKMVPLDYVLKTGDIVEIVTSNSSKGPSSDWLNIVKTNQARSKIRQWIKRENKAENIELGKSELEKEAKSQGFVLSRLLDKKLMEPMFRRYSFKMIDDMYAAVGYGGVTAKQIVTWLIQNSGIRSAAKQPQPQMVVVKNPEGEKGGKGSSEIKVKNESGMLVRLASCCNPVYGDEIVGYITRGRGVSVHRADCKSLMKSNTEKDRLIEVEWADNKGTRYPVRIQIIASDRPGLIADITKTIYNIGSDIQSIKANTTENRTAVIGAVITISSVDDVQDILRRIKSLKGVMDATRANQ